MIKVTKQMILAVWDWKIIHRTDKAIYNHIMQEPFKWDTNKRKYES